MDFDDSIMVCIQHNSIIKNSFTTIKISCAYAILLYFNEPPRLAQIRKKSPTN